MGGPYFQTAWEREDYERQQRGEKPLGPLGFGAGVCPVCSGLGEIGGFVGSIGSGAEGYQTEPCPQCAQFTHSEETCPGHIASADDPKVCGRCGVHIDSMRPDNDE